MKKLFSIIMVLSLLIGISSCGKPKNSVSMNPGTYSSTEVSQKGNMVVHVTVDETTITGINVESVDTEQIITAVIKRLIPEIIEKQSIGVDSITGASVSSGSLKKGVENCLKQAGADVSKFKTKTVIEKSTGRSEEKTVVVVGSGAAGLSTAIQLTEAGIENVVVLEKLGYFGGTSAHSSGGVWVTGGTDFNKMSGYDYTPDELVKHMYATTGAEAGTLNDKLIRKIAEVSGDVFTDYVEKGAPWDLTRFTFGDNLNEMPVSWVSSFYDTPWESGAGRTLVDFLLKTAEKNGVELRLDSNVTKLISNGNEVTGVVVETPGEVYEIKADKVVLATGGFQQNKGLVEELAAEYADMIPFTGAGSTGDGIIMAKELGAQTVGYGIGGARGLNGRFGYQGPMGLLVWVVGPLVNKNGVRFAAETEHYSYSPSHLVSQPGAVSFGITDGNNSMIEYLEEAVKLGYVYKSDSLEDLAVKAGIQPDAFIETVEKYNSAAESGIDDPDFGVPNSALAPVLKAPYYAVKTYAVTSFSLAGLKTDEDCKILNEDGLPIENLYGAGELICGNIFYGTYSGSGSQVGSAVYEGRIVADSISTELDIK